MGADNAHLTAHGFLTLSEVVEATEGRLFQGEPRQSVSGISIDSRTLKPGELFVALKGERFDGHDFLYTAFRQGAVGAVIEIVKHRIPQTAEEENLRQGRAIIGVNDTLSALQGLARFHRKRFDLPVVAVTGSNGKTTTKEMAAGILARDREVLASEGNQNNQVGVPLTLFRMTSRHQAAVVEMGISLMGEMRILTEMARPLVGLITNIGPTHLETLGSVERVAEAKGELLGALPATGVAILNRDDPFFDALSRRASCRVVTFGLQPGAQVTATDTTVKDHRITTFTLRVQPEAMGLIGGSGTPRSSASATEIEIRLPLLGAHNVANAVAAGAVAVVLGCGLDQIKQALEVFQPPAMRSQILEKRGVVILNDAYNANPASMNAALSVLSQWKTKGRRIAVLGDMLELGEAEHRAHWEVGEDMARVPTGRLIAIGPRARIIAEAALSRGMKKERVSVCQDANEGVEVLKGAIQPGDVVLIKGSRGMHLERVVEGFLKQPVGGKT
jgi:UDP-N-acetylmuramoyl-tripeptide--D-alanyl-D-alanine ligase